MNNTVSTIVVSTPEQSLLDLARTAGESIEQSTQALVNISTALLEQLKTVRSAAGAAVETNNVAPLYMSVSQALERYGISRSTFYQIIQLEDCPKLGKVGKKTIIPIAAFDEFFCSLIMMSDRTKDITDRS